MKCADITPTEVGNAVWMTVHGCHLLSDALHDDPFVRLTDGWRLLLRGMVPPESLGYFEEVLDRTCSTYAAA